MKIQNPAARHAPRSQARRTSQMQRKHAQRARNASDEMMMMIDDDGG
jgi:hypothetical protein